MHRILGSTLKMLIQVCQMLQTRLLIQTYLDVNYNFDRNWKGSIATLLDRISQSRAEWRFARTEIDDYHWVNTLE